MSVTGLSSPTLVIDASTAVWAVLPFLQDAGINAFERFVDWHSNGIRLIAPTWWLAEATSAIRRAVYARTLSNEGGSEAVEQLFTLRIEAVPIGAPLCKSALQWAARLQQARAYDAFYL